MQRHSVLSRRNPRLNKKDFGHVLIVAGSPTMLGAAALCALAAMRAGAGMTTAAVARSLNLALQKKISSVVMTLKLPQTPSGEISFSAFNVLKKNFKKYNAVAIGPGLGLHIGTTRLVHCMVEDYPGPMVVDADALNALAKNTKLLLAAKGPRVLTPHTGEMARLTAKTAKYIEANRQTVALNFAKQHGCVLVMKGHCTVIASPNGKLFVNSTGNVGMATAGSGDVLTGIITAFLGQGLSAFEAARLGVYIHGKAGDLAVKKRSKAGLIALDLIEQIPSVL